MFRELSGLIGAKEFLSYSFVCAWELEMPRDECLVPRSGFAHGNQGFLFLLPMT